MPVGPKRRENGGKKILQNLLQQLTLISIPGKTKRSNQQWGVNQVPSERQQYPWCCFKESRSVLKIIQLHNKTPGLYHSQRTETTMTGLVLVPLMPFAGQPMEFETEDMIIPRLVSRIAQLEAKLHDAGATNFSNDDDDSLVARLTSLLKTAQSSLDSWLSYILGGPDEVNQAMTEEAKAKALMITIRQVGEMKNHAALLKERLALMEQAAVDNQAAYVEEIGGLQGELEISTAFIETLTAKINELENGTEELSSKLQRSEALAGAFRSSLMKQESQLAELKQQMESLSAQLDASQQENDVLNRRASSSETSARLVSAELETARASKAATMQVRVCYL